MCLLIFYTFYTYDIVDIPGRHYGLDRDTLENPDIPLEIFKVKKGGKYRFRLICSSMTFAFRVSIDNHMLNIIATDGYDVTTKQVESVIVFSGERYDFWIDADDPLENGTYWIRAETLERAQNGQVRFMYVALF